MINIGGVILGIITLFICYGLLCGKNRHIYQREWLSYIYPPIAIGFLVVSICPSYFEDPEFLIYTLIFILSATTSHIMKNILKKVISGEYEGEEVLFTNKLSEIKNKKLYFEISEYVYFLIYIFYVYNRLQN